MRVAELKALTTEHGLRGYSRMRKAEIIELIRNKQQGLASWAPDIPKRSVGSVTPSRNGTTPPGGVQAPWVWKTQVAKDPRPAHSLWPLVDQHDPTKLNRLGLDQIVQDSLGSLIHKKWIYLNNKK